MTAMFVKNYYESVQRIKNGNADIDRKGKKHVVSIDEIKAKQQSENKAIMWEKPSAGWKKLMLMPAL